VCMQAGCGTRFGLTHHRHHCRVCGAVVCAACSRTRIALPQLSPRPQRVCKGCLNLAVPVSVPGASHGHGATVTQAAAAAPASGSPAQALESDAGSSADPDHASAATSAGSLSISATGTGSVSGSANANAQLSESRSAFAGEVASSVVTALLSLASRVPLVGPCAGVLQDIFAMHGVSARLCWCQWQWCEVSANGGHCSAT
jgi:hypothetical protein